MNRPKPNRIRTKAHIIYLSDEEENAVKLRMERVKIKSFSKYCRKMMIDGYVLVIDDSKELKEFTYEINKIGFTINQIAHALNSGDSIPKETIDQLKDWMVTIWQYQRYILSDTPF